MGLQEHPEQIKEQLDAVLPAVTRGCWVVVFFFPSFPAHGDNRTGLLRRSWWDDALAGTSSVGTGCWHGWSGSGSASKPE